jgi:threonine dehydrogenase-like Zn-dependent dehydrogenase
MGHMPAYEQAYGIIRPGGTIEPGKVFDSTTDLDGVPGGYQAMSDRESLKVLVTP